MISPIRMVMKYVYVLRSKRWPEKLYIGVSPDPSRRLKEHNQSKCSSTKKFKPWRIVHLERYQDNNAAFQREQQLKKWSRGKKEALIREDTDKLGKLSKCRQAGSIRLEVTAKPSNKESGLP